MQIPMQNSYNLFFHCLSCFSTIFYLKTTQKSTETCNNMAKDTSVKDTVSQSKLLAVKLSLLHYYDRHIIRYLMVWQNLMVQIQKKLYVCKKKGTRKREISDVNGIITV